MKSSRVWRANASASPVTITAEAGIILLPFAPSVRPTSYGCPTVSRVIQQFKGTVTRQLGQPLWQKGFYDRVLRDEADYLRIWDYMDQNSAKWAEDESFEEAVP